MVLSEVAASWPRKNQHVAVRSDNESSQMSTIVSTLCRQVDMLSLDDVNAFARSAVHRLGSLDWSYQSFEISFVFDMEKTAACYFRLQKHIFPIADVPQDSFKLACKTNCAYYRFARKEAKCVPFLTEASQDLSSILHRHLPATDLWDKANAGQAQSFTIDAIKAELRDGKIRSLKVECNANLLQRIDF